MLLFGLPAYIGGIYPQTLNLPLDQTTYIVVCVKHMGFQKQK